MVVYSAWMKAALLGHCSEHCSAEPLVAKTVAYWVSHWVTPKAAKMVVPTEKTLAASMVELRGDWKAAPMAPY